MKDQTKQTTFCAKLRKARWSNRRASGPNRFVDLGKESRVSQLSPNNPLRREHHWGEGWGVVLTAFPGGRPG
jgi:hypothetical protein